MVVGSLDIETDVLVIGSGPGGYVAAIRAAQLGAEVLIVEKEKIGGVCLHTGCIPTKALIHASNFFNALKELDSMGIMIEKYHVDIAKMHDWKDGILQKLEEGIKGLLKSNNIEVIYGAAVFVNDNLVRIEGKTDVSTIKFKRCVIATGSDHADVPILPIDGKFIISSDEAIKLDSVPKSLAIIGGGYIGTELGTVYGKLGTEVHIIEATDRLLSVLEPDIVDVMVSKLFEFNIHLHLNTVVKGCTIEGDYVALETSSGNIRANKVLVVVGRKPLLPSGLSNTSVKLDAKGFIIVDKQMRSTCSHIFAVGDVVGQPMLAHKATRQAKVAAEALSGLPSYFDNKVIPFVVFNDPEIASVGLKESEAKAKGYDYIVGKFPFKALGRAMTLNQTDGFVKYIAERTTGLILGVHAVGPSASDIISEATLAIEMGATLEDVALTIHPHPTIPESLMEAADVTLNKGINIFKGK